MITDTEDKQAWCKYGEKLEREFVASKSFDFSSFRINPDKETNPYTYDLVMENAADLKSCKTPWRLSDKLFNIPSSYAVTLDEKDVERYTLLYPTITLIFDVDYPTYKAVHFTDLHRIKELIEQGKAYKHIYKKRINDTKGNAKTSFVFDVRHLPIMATY
jgi:hypothetical protein